MCIRLLRAVLRAVPSLLPKVRRLVFGKAIVCVFGGHGGEAFDDNSQALALYYAQDPKTRVYWISKSGKVFDANKHPKIKQLKRNSFRAEFTYNLCNLAFYSHGLSDLTTRKHTQLTWRVLVLLGHGVEGFKKGARFKVGVDDIAFDYTISCSHWQTGVKKTRFGLDSSKCIQSGLPKHDRLIQGKRNQRTSAEIHEVLYMPTWRDWLSRRPTLQSVEKHIEGIASVVEAMPETDSSGRKFKITLVVHKNSREILGDLRDRISNAPKVSSKVEICLSHEVNLANIIEGHSSLITDYSSVFWDFILLGKPAVRFPFDETIYDWITGAYKEATDCTKDVTFRTPQKVWDYISNPQHTSQHDLAEKWMEYSQGYSCKYIKDFLSKKI
ncbi:CDP-glycerol glycerophosphotransferase family protein [Celeribacter halophilus]|uniref:CDP-glycerol glycerophosphotransferase family protein n=1 Tax=Celeribacter halophilus TaxID=576117 RepID=A0AAW7XSK1_9RHOB|nr:CDP-glycerol glycerophosphotransferase family protein [Celeribacter halophilus]MDO6457010.1 CDP-glycerol glycerophosphotransferase family protein [Celeribacter halophilus]MDO6723671.1 CDP-glycerol glycerophosphotransferase family protein [Celeribacter halophilus]